MHTRLMRDCLPPSQKEPQSHLWQGMTFLIISFENPNSRRSALRSPLTDPTSKRKPAGLWLAKPRFLGIITLLSSKWNRPSKRPPERPLGKGNFSNSSSPMSPFSYCLPQWPGASAVCTGNLIGSQLLNSQSGSSWMTSGCANWPVSDLTDHRETAGDWYVAMPARGKNPINSEESETT